MDGTTILGIKKSARVIFLLTARHERRYLEDATARPHYCRAGRGEQIVVSEFANVFVTDVITDALNVVGDEIARNGTTMLLTFMARALCPREAELSTCKLHERASLIAHFYSLEVS